MKLPGEKAAKANALQQKIIEKLSSKLSATKVKNMQSQIDTLMTEW